MMSSTETTCGDRYIDSGLSSLYDDENEMTLIEGCCGNLLIDVRNVVTPTGTGKIVVDSCCGDVRVVHSPFQRIQRTGSLCCGSENGSRDMRKREMKAMGLPPTHSNIIVDVDLSCGNSSLFLLDMGQEVKGCPCCGGIGF